MVVSALLSVFLDCPFCLQDSLNKAAQSKLPVMYAQAQDKGWSYLDMQFQWLVQSSPGGEENTQEESGGDSFWEAMGQEGSKLFLSSLFHML